MVYRVWGKLDEDEQDFQDLGFGFYMKMVTIQPPRHKVSKETRMGFKPRWMFTIQRGKPLSDREECHCRGLGGKVFVGPPKPDETSGIVFNV